MLHFYPNQARWINFNSLYTGFGKERVNDYLDIGREKKIHLFTDKDRPKTECTSQGALPTELLCIKIQLVNGIWYYNQI